MPETVEKTLPTLSWDTYEIAKNQADFLMEQDPDLSKDDAFNDACRDTGLYTFEWEFLCESLTDELKAINPDFRKWKVSVENFGWRHLSGCAAIDAEDGRTFLQKVLPDCECTFTITIDKEEGLITINNAHHDAPTGGEMYYARVMPTCDCCGRGEDEAKIMEEGDDEYEVICEFCKEENE